MIRPTLLRLPVLAGAGAVLLLPLPSRGAMPAGADFREVINRAKERVFPAVVFIKRRLRIRVADLHPRLRK